MAHRMNCWARLKDGDRAHQIYQLFIAEKTVPNLWTLHPPFQIDGNFGVMAGVAEMLLQSHEGYIELLPALPQAWSEGSFEGLAARGNCELSANWSGGSIRTLKVNSRSGGECRLKFPGNASAQVVDAAGEKVDSSLSAEGILVFATLPDRAYRVLL